MAITDKEYFEKLAKEKEEILRSVMEKYQSKTWSEARDGMIKAADDVAKLTKKYGTGSENY